MRYCSCPDVLTHHEYAPRQHHTYCETLITFLHGNMSKAHVKKLGDIITAEARELVGRIRCSVAFSGHLHHELASVDLGGLVRYQTPTPSPTCS